jgi:hypothetical protein
MTAADHRRRGHGATPPTEGAPRPTGVQLAGRGSPATHEKPAPGRLNPGLGSGAARPIVHPRATSFPITRVFVCPIPDAGIHSSTWDSSFRRGSRRLSREMDWAGSHAIAGRFAAAGRCAAGTRAGFLEDGLPASTSFAGLRPRPTNDRRARRWKPLRAEQRFAPAR